MYCCAPNVVHLSQNRKALPSIFGLLSCSSTFSHHLSSSPLYLSLLPPVFRSLYPLQPLSNPLLSFSAAVSYLLFLSVFILVLLFYILHSPVLSSFLSLFTSCWYEGVLQRCSTLKHDKYCSVSALSSSQCCTVMQTSMRAVGENWDKMCGERETREWEWYMDTEINTERSEMSRDKHIW